MAKEKPPANDPTPKGFWDTGDWVIVLLALCMLCVCLAGFAAVKGGL